MSRLELPEGAWAELASPRKVPERKRRRYIAAMTDLSSGTVDLPQVAGPPDANGLPGPPVPDPRHFGSAHMALADAVGDMLILALVREWSFGEVTLEVLEELPGDVFDPLFLRCRDLAAELTPDYSPDPDPKARSGSSRPALPASSTVPPIYATSGSDGTS